MVFLRFSPTFIGSPFIDFLRREVIRREPPVCFLTVFEIVFLIACFVAHYIQNLWYTLFQELFSDTFSSWQNEATC